MHRFLNQSKDTRSQGNEGYLLRGVNIQIAELRLHDLLHRCMTACLHAVCTHATFRSVMQLAALSVGSSMLVNYRSVHCADTKPTTRPWTSTIRFIHPTAGNHLLALSQSFKLPNHSAMLPQNGCMTQPCCPDSPVVSGSLGYIISYENS
jgi:hypothetical protein